MTASHPGEHRGSDTERGLPDWLVRAEALFRQGETEGAGALVADALATTPHDADALLLRGLIASRRRDHGAAIEALRASLAVRPDAPRAWLALGNAHARAGDPAAAAVAYRETLDREPGWSDARFNLGLMQKRLGDRAPALRSFHAAWVRDPLLFDAASQCVAAIAESVRAGDSLEPQPAPTRRDPALSPLAVSIVVCSIDDAKHERAVALYQNLFRAVRHEVISIRNARSLAEAYNWALRRSAADVIVLSHDDVDILAPDFAARLWEHLQSFDVVGVAGSTRMDGPALGWSGHPHLRGWITHRAPGDADWRADVLDPRPVSGGMMLLDGVLLAGRREALRVAAFDAVTFDGFHLADLDWSYRAAQAGLRLGVAGDLLLVHASRGRYDATWQRYADRFCTKHATGRSPAQPSSFFGATLDGPQQVRAFFALLGSLSDPV
ncbi:MAG: glycosyltransferase [Casimicrobiaceae bacterium]